MSFRLLTKAWRQTQPNNRSAYSYILPRSFSRQSQRFVILSLLSNILILIISHFRVSITDLSLLRRPSFGISFDIDGVILLGNTPVGGSPAALRKLYDAEGQKQKQNYLYPFSLFRVYFLSLRTRNFVFFFFFNTFSGRLKIPYVFLTNGEFLYCLSLVPKCCVPCN